MIPGAYEQNRYQPKRTLRTARKRPYADTALTPSLYITPSSWLTQKRTAAEKNRKHIYVKKQYVY